MIMHEDSRLIRFSDGIVSLLESEIDINLRNYQKQSKALSQALNQFSDLKFFGITLFRKH
ncbi:hypothetical protein RchiOBHm_Chr4g0419131 [Rosa chinensis]|uniref:Uncharacterized protein n=1 Tax=Rosa chinensis TaxID=74649 RepID=A0A2P6QXI2_ROSCH|nr:hypothetical protein RchiOBHm_Chr4g0419131 [Rosa chinensis]